MMKILVKRRGNWELVIISCSIQLMRPCSTYALSLFGTNSSIKGVLHDVTVTCIQCYLTSWTSLAENFSRMKFEVCFYQFVTHFWKLGLLHEKENSHLKPIEYDGLRSISKEVQVKDKIAEWINNDSVKVESQSTPKSMCAANTTNTDNWMKNCEVE